MICLICRLAETVERLTSVKFERGEAQVVINNVPARVCPECGEAYVEEEVATQLLRIADDISASGELTGASEYTPARG
jgi:YgiT-type zinc finger domain-containing protein